MTYDLAILSSHPIQYKAPLYRRIAQDNSINLKVFYGSLLGVEEPCSGEKGGMGEDHTWDIPLLEGYDYSILTNYSPFDNHSPLGVLPLTLFRNLKELDPDALWLNGWGKIINWVGLKTSNWLGIPVFTRTESTKITESISRNSVLRDSLVSYFIKNVDAALSIGSLNSNFYLNKGMREKEIFDVPYAVDNERFYDQHTKYKPEVPDLKSDLGIPPDKKIILYLSGMYERKRPGDLLEAFQTLGLRERAHLVFAGDGEKFDDLKTRTKNTDDVSFVGFVNQSELSRYYSLGDIFVLPSTNEPWGLVVNEAMCHGLPVITTSKVGSAYDLVHEGENGFIYSPGDVVALSQHLDDLLANPEKLEQFGHQSKRIIDNWSYDEDVEGVRKALHYVTD